MSQHIGTVGWVNQERAKLGVIRLGFDWYVIGSDGAILIRGDGEFAKFPTHAEAIAYAQQRARLTCRSCGRAMPYLEACIDGRAYCHPDKGPDCYAETSRTLAIERFATLPSYDKDMTS